MRKRGLIIVALAIIVLAVIVGFYAGYYSTQEVELSENPPRVVSIEVVPDFGGATYDAFVISSNVTGNLPKPASSSNGPGVISNTITVPLDVPVKFVITSIDSAINMNYSGRVTVPFTIYNDTNSGMVAVNYPQGQSISKLLVGHTFAIDSLNLSIPIPPLTIVEFNYTFTQVGSFFYHCTIPCGLGMGLMGYMQGFVNVSPVAQNELVQSVDFFMVRLARTAANLPNLPNIYFFQLFLLIAVSLIGMFSTDKSNTNHNTSTESR